MSAHERAGEVRLLECTLRDGSYAVDFRFTVEDTFLICRILAGLGFRFIEIGHGLGINASNSGKGKMPASDRKLLEVAKSAAGASSKIGMFFIPGIATMDDLTEMSGAGLDFIRIGCNAGEVEETFKYIEAARKNNVYAMVNFMKSYTIPPKEFARKSKSAAQAGADVVYIVDSSGGMLPEEVAGYVEESKAAVDIEIGIHAHNNLHLAAANALQAVKSGASFVDTTLYGIGRSAGNVPTEAMISILKNKGIDTGVDVFKLMDMAERYLAPLASRIRMHDMLSVAIGSGKFHTSFLPALKSVADEYNVDLRRLVYLMGRRDPSNVDADELREVAGSLESIDAVKLDYDITSFYSPRIGKGYISNTLKSVTELVDGLSTVSAKGRLHTIVELVAAADLNESMVIAEYVTSDEHMVLGRVCFGSMEVLKSVMGLIKGHVSFIMIDLDNLSGTVWADEDEVCSEIKMHMDASFIIPIRFKEIRYAYLLDTLRQASMLYGHKALFVYGGDFALYSALRACFNEFKSVFWLKPGFLEAQPAGVVVLENMRDLKALNIQADIVLCAEKASADDMKILLRIAGENGKIIDIRQDGRSNVTVPENGRFFHIDYNDAYKGMVRRWLDIKDNLNAERHFEN